MAPLVKSICLGIYVLALAGAVIALPSWLAAGVPIVAAVLLTLHAIELLLAFRTVRRHPGPLIDSIALTLLFGVLHWWPLAARARSMHPRPEQE